MRAYVSQTCNPWGVQIGNKKQGLPPTVGKDAWSSLAIQTYAIGDKRNWIFNNGGALSGVGAGVSSFASQGNNWISRGGVRRTEPYEFVMPVHSLKV
jgi:hypothetical protein